MKLKLLLFIILSMCSLAAHAQALYGNRFNEIYLPNVVYKYNPTSGFTLDTFGVFRGFNAFYALQKYNNYLNTQFSICDEKGRFQLHANEHYLFDSLGIVDSPKTIAPLVCEYGNNWFTSVSGGNCNFIVPVKNGYLTIVSPLKRINGKGHRKCSECVIGDGIWLSEVSRGADGRYHIDTNYKLIDEELPIGAMQLVKHANGRDYWLLYQSYNTMNYRKILLQSNGGIIKFNDTQPFSWYDNRSFPLLTSTTVFSDDGEHMFEHQYFKDSFYFYRFDRCSGNLTLQFEKKNPIPITTLKQKIKPLWLYTFYTSFSTIIMNTINLCDIKSNPAGSFYFTLAIDWSLEKISYTKLADSADTYSLSKPSRLDSTFLIKYWINSLIKAPNDKVYFFPYSAMEFVRNGYPVIASTLEQSGDSLVFKLNGAQFAENYPYPQYQFTNWFSDVFYTNQLYNPVLGPVAGSVCDSLSTREPEVVDLDPKMPTREYTPPAPLPPKAKPLQLFPNPPVNGWVYLQGLPEGSKPLLHLTDMLGRTVATLQAANYSNGNYSFNTQNLPAGVYTASLVYPPTNLQPTKLVVVE